MPRRGGAAWRRDLHRSGDAPEPEPRRPRHAPPESAPSASFLAALEEQRRAHAAEAAAAGTGAGAAAPPSPPPPPPPPSLPGHVYDAERKRFFKIRRDGDVSSAETLRRIEAARPVPAPVLPLLSPRFGPSLGLVPHLLAREGGAAAACLRAAPVDPLARVRARTVPVWTGLCGRITGASFSGHLAVTSVSLFVREGPAVCRRRPLPLVVADECAGGKALLVLGGGPRRARASTNLHSRMLTVGTAGEAIVTAAAFQPPASDSHPSSFHRSTLLATSHHGHADADSYLAITRVTAEANNVDVDPRVVTSEVKWERVERVNLGRAGPWSLAWTDRENLAVGCSSDQPTHLFHVHESRGNMLHVTSIETDSDVFCICPCDPAAGEAGVKGDWGPWIAGAGGPPPLLLGQRNGQISLWDAMRCETSTLLRQQKQQRGGAASSVVALAAVGGPTSGLFVVADAGTQLQVRDWRAWDRGPVFEEGARGYANTPHRLGVAVSGGVGGEGTSVAACCADGLVRVWSLEDGGRLRLAAAHAVPAGAAVDGGGAARPTRVAWSPAGPGEAALEVGEDGGSGEGKGGAEGDEEEEGMDKERRRRAWAGGCFLVGGTGFGDLLAVPPG